MFYPEVDQFLSEDGVELNRAYLDALPIDMVECHVQIKSPLTLAGTPWFIATFNRLKANLSENLMQYEGEEFAPGSSIPLELPFSAATAGERVALNLLQRASAIATYTKEFVSLAAPLGIAILDTRKTTPGLRSLEKYAVTVGGGKNHRFNQSDVWMIKDNHKLFFGGIREAITFFQKMSSFYAPLMMEVHSLEELEEVLNLGKINNIMLDNFSPSDLKCALEIKPQGVKFEVSGGINIENITDYLLPGVDAISIGSLTSYPPPVDISFDLKERS